MEEKCPETEEKYSKFGFLRKKKFPNKLCESMKCFVLCYFWAWAKKYANHSFAIDSVVLDYKLPKMEVLTLEQKPEFFCPDLWFQKLDLV